MKLKDTDYLYATMRIRANERTLLTAQTAERMVEAKTPGEAAKVLADAGYKDISTSSFSDVERSLRVAREETLRLIDEICENKYILEVFALKYDFHNIKTVIKSAITNQDPEPLMADGTLVPKDELLAAFRTDDTSKLPPRMAEAFVTAKETLAHTGDPQVADFILDNACFDMMAEAAKKSRSSFLCGYVALLADISNLRSSVRSVRRGKDNDILKQCLVGGGNVGREVFLTYDFENGFKHGPLEEAAAFGAKAAEGSCGFLEFERELDNAVIKYMQTAKYVSFDERPIIAYIAAKENEAMMIRIIMAGKLEGLTADEIRSRLRVF